MPTQMNIGDILIQGGVVKPDQVEKAKKMANAASIPIEEAIVKLGYATDEAIAMSVSKLLGVPYASKENKILRPEKDQDLDKVIDEKFARENALLPLFLDDNVLAVTMAEPGNMLVLDNLRLMSGYEVQPFISTKAQILNAIDDFYGGSTNIIDRVMEAKTDGDEDTSIEEVDVTGKKLDLDQMASAAKGAAVVQMVNAILKQAIAERASDIHLEMYDEKVTLRFRIHGTLYERTAPSKDAFTAVISRIKILSKLDIAERRLPQDGAFSLKVQNRIIDMRVSICPTVFGEKLVMRILDKGAVSLTVKGLGFEKKQMEDFMRAADSPHGLIFLTGPTGSGKTTTLYAVLNTIKTPEMNFMTIEDPVEFKLEGINQVQVRANIGLTFASALRSFLRQDPDVILVGEVRDKETAETCLRASLTGHLVLSTLHTNSALEAVVRLVDMGIEPFMLGSSLRLLAAQRLIRVLCTCKKAYQPEKATVDQCLAECLLNPKPNPAQLVFYKESKCGKCNHTGFVGRKALYEVYYITRALRQAIFEKHQDLRYLRETALKEGMFPMRTSGWRKVIEGITTVQEIMDATVGD